MAERRLHIGVDGRELVGQPTGVGRYVREVLRQWTSTAGWPHTLTVFVPGPPSTALVHELGPAVRWSVLPAHRGGTWWEQWQLWQAARKASLDVFFAGAYTAPRLLACPFVVVVHDVSFFAHPEWFAPREGIRRRWLTRATARRADAVLTVSEFSASEIVRFLGIPRSRIALAPPGGPAPRERTNPSFAHEPVVLYVGSLFNRRLIPELIQGFAVLVRSVPDAKLILVGDNRTEPRIDPQEVAARAGVAARVEWRDYVSDTELEALYSSARVFAFLSTYEGFAMTPLEAVAHGVPPVMLDTPVAREIYGAGARLVASTPDSIAAALTTLLQDPAAHAAQVLAGTPLLGRYLWADTAATIQFALERAAPSR